LLLPSYCIKQNHIAPSNYKAFYCIALLYSLSLFIYILLNQIWAKTYLVGGFNPFEKH